ncbi:hypothetical protein N7468_008487 [Penicillium chermesinum]|uniref:Uncharacterized protein n=1 Tax=Penicillium chermesinum TaxID=63820 RepID=A0A9W9NPU0_9EURO|nr:uncharacterized protein N7468_008487 [Penicillium chermesinum]KAJ5223945.1 hypothetical protein N7468_008487 [Penicillium chermesinum]KAJ6155234.1 hypothetical protein N7470_005800 [Penicillium chermesinum]
MKLSTLLALLPLALTAYATAGVEGDGEDDVRYCLRKKAPAQFECVGGLTMSAWKSNVGWTCCDASTL